MLGTARITLASLLVLGPVVVAAAPRAARASDDLVIDTKGFALDGDQSFRTIIVKKGGSLGVIPVSKGKGWLHLRANKVVVEEGGTISAAGAGYVGKEGKDGDGPGGGKVPAGVPQDAKPGGGGAHAAAGGTGVSLAPACDLVGGVGGAAYGAPSDPNPTNWLGSAGGAALAVSNGTRGGNGGGAIVIEAATVQLAGVVLADGEDGLSSSSGGGAGGFVRIRAFDLVVGAATHVSVHGGVGGGAVAAKVFGGGGAGGFVTIEAPAPKTPLVPDIAGGTAGLGCTDAAKGAGAEGAVTMLPAPASCLDLDGDGHAAEECGGDDCDDVDGAIHPGQKETCDGIDNDCSGKADDGTPASLCGVSLVCSDGQCVPPKDAGADAAPTTSEPATSPPDHLEYTGGCAFGGASTAGSGAALLALVGALAARRRAKRHP
jgi:hypothetical protein